MHTAIEQKGPKLMHSKQNFPLVAVTTFVLGAALSGFGTFWGVYLHLEDRFVSREEFKAEIRGLRESQGKSSVTVQRELDQIRRSLELQRESLEKIYQEIRR